ncbi:hypothetical protein CTAYLR_007613 [Chrysophaeum taylorii]|uniref:GH16 domain-containing protein n=1 Tax=Chrysophaeum taylorii TaxID=2483200 RepID=A0AAD7U8L5_9STRA|nr:hypothetical protein CTAYLR_007613 [Chrysophaeum taylorii]
MLWLVLGVARAGWVDPDSPRSARTTVSLVDRVEVPLVFSDEFEVEGREFDDGFDPRWTAIHKNDYTNAALHYYHQEYVRTSNGFLNVTTDAVETEFESLQLSKRRKGKIKAKTLKKEFRSGMVQTWNKFCFSGGILEVRVKLPGRHDVGGLWPATWLMGNLARSTYVASSDYMWPWSYDRCDRANQIRQEISACKPSPHYGLDANRGRGAPEIDLLEVMPGSGWLPWGLKKPYVSTSLQVAPGKTNPRPSNGDRPHPGQWYEGLRFGKNSSINVFFYGLKLDHHDETSYVADAISGNTPIRETHFTDFHTFRLEWEPRGYINWYVDDFFLYGIDDESLGECTGAHVPDEPSYLLINTAMSSTWGFPFPCPPGCDCKCHDCVNPKCKCAMPPGFCETLPAHFLVDYVRVYQRPQHKLGCSTDTHPTKRFIQGHSDRYSDPDVRASRKRPLRDVEVGGGPCRVDSDCGGGGGGGGSACRRRRCDCKEGATGPTCRAAAAHDDVIYDDLDDIHVFDDLRRFYAPPAMDRLCLAFLLLILAIVVAHVARTKHQRGLYDY